MNRVVFSLIMICAAGCSNSSKDKRSTLLDKPNIVVILTDQERYPAHWPNGWAEDHLSSTVRLKQNGLTFHRAYTAAAECSPSRAVMMSGEYDTINRVSVTFKPPGLPSEKELIDIGALLQEKAGYDVVWKGKWHLSYSVNGGVSWNVDDIANLDKQYSMQQWNPPDAGNAIQEFEKAPQTGLSYSGLSTLGGGFADNDGRYVHGPSNTSKQTPGFGESVLSYLKKIAQVPAKERKPFCLFISLVNPHDVWVYPGLWEKAGYQKDNFANLGIELPDNFADDLATKPSVQLKAREAFNRHAPLENQQANLEYVNFYAYLHTVVDRYISDVLDALQENNMLDNTIIIRTADHGELGLSHGMREKAYTAYEEMIHVPFIVSNPKLYPQPRSTDAFYCHLDLMPTLADIVGIPNAAKYGKGVSMVPVLKNPTASVQDSILFAYDDIFFLPSTVPGGHIRAIREGDWTYAVYYSQDGKNFEYEMYNLKEDPQQLINLVYGSVAPEVARTANRLHAKLKTKIDQTEALPAGFSWPKAPF